MRTMSFYEMVKGMGASAGFIAFIKLYPTDLMIIKATFCGCALYLIVKTYIDSFKFKKEVKHEVKSNKRCKQGKSK
jgi:hypothetical protein